MAMLEKRFYPRQEIAEIVGIADLHDKHFAEKVKRYLNNRGYGYNYSRNGVTISRTPQTAEEQLAFLLVEDVGIDIQTNAYDFACFITAFSVIGSFDSMPWASRTAFFNQHYNNRVSQATLQRWMRRLTESGNAERFSKGALWRTVVDNDGDKIQVRVDPNSDEYQAYCDRRSALLTGYDNASPTEKSRMWASMVHSLYEEYGVYYYCPQFILNGLGEQAEEISRLVAQVMAERQEGKK